MALRPNRTKGWSTFLVVVAAAALAASTGAGGATGAAIQEAPLSPGAGPSTIAVGPDGALWFTEEGVNRIGRMTTGKVLTEFPVPTQNAVVGGIATGRDGNIWFLETKTFKLAQLVPATGRITEFHLPVEGNGIVNGSDGNLWLVGSTSNRVLVVSTAGTVLRTLTVPTSGAFPHGPAVGPDGNVYFAEVNGNKIARVTTAGAFKEWRLPHASSKPMVVAFGPDGRLYFTESAGNRIGRLDTATGAIVEFAVPTPASSPQAIAAGPDGNLWFTENKANQIALVTTAGAISEFSLPVAGSAPKHITAGPDGNLWFTQTSDIGIATPPAGGPPSSPTNTSRPSISGNANVGQTLTASAGSWTGAPTFAFDWQRCDANGANCVTTGMSGQRYTIAPPDLGSTLVVVVTATNSAGSATASSPSTAVVTSGGGGGSAGVGSPPSTPVLDSFNRTNGPAGPNWAPIKPTGFSALNVVGNAAADASTSQFAWDYWTAAAFGPNAEAYVTIPRYGSSDVIRIGARVTGAGTTAFSGYFVSINATGTWSIIRIDQGGSPATLATGPTQALSSGDSVAVQVIGSVVAALHGKPGSGWAMVLSYDTAGDSVRYTASGNVALELKTSTVDDFGGGTLP